jgi:hypothetical protein
MTADVAEQNNGQGVWGTITRTVGIYILMNLVMKQMGLVPSQQNQQQAAAAGRSGTPAAVPPAPAVKLSNAWAAQQSMDLRVYVTEQETFRDFGDREALVWQEHHLTYSRQDDSARALNLTLSPSARVQRNESALWAHIYVSRAGTSPDPAAPEHDPLGTASAHHPLVKILKRKRPKATRNLLSLSGEQTAGQEAAPPLGGEGEDTPAVEWLPHWKPTLTISIVEDFTVYPSLAAVPPQVRPALSVNSERGHYLPVIYVNEFWVMADRYMPLNETVADVNLEMSFSVTNLMRWMLTEQMQQSLQMQSGMHGEDTIDDMRRMFAETSPWLLVLTGLVSLLHTVFDILAFKNDIR